MESGIAHTHQSARDWPVAPLAVSCHCAMTPLPSCSMAVTLVRSRSTGATSRPMARAIASMPPAGWNSVVW